MRVFGTGQLKVETIQLKREKNRQSQKRRYDRLHGFRTEENVPESVKAKRERDRKSQARYQAKKRTLKKGLKAKLKGIHWGRICVNGADLWAAIREQRLRKAENTFYFYNDLCRFYLLKRAQRYL